jgi:hypothetical protein
MWHDNNAQKLIQRSGVLAGYFCFSPPTIKQALSFPTQNRNNTNMTLRTVPKDQHNLSLLSTAPGPVVRTGCNPLPLSCLLRPARSYQPYVADLSPSSEPTIQQEAAQQLCKSLPSERNKTDFVSSLSFSLSYELPRCFFSVLSHRLLF